MDKHFESDLASFDEHSLLLMNSRGNKICNLMILDKIVYLSDVLKILSNHDIRG